MDREIRDPIDLLDEIEAVLKISCAPINWPIGCGKDFKGVYSLHTDTIHVFQQGQGSIIPEDLRIEGLYSDEASEFLSYLAISVREEIELVKGATNSFDMEMFLNGQLAPVFFGTALANFGIREMLDNFVDLAPPPQFRAAIERNVAASEEEFSGFVFKIQANMDPKHRDRIAFVRICSGRYIKGMKIRHVRQKKDLRISDAVGFKAGERVSLDEAVAGDIIGIHNHGTIQIGDTFTTGENIKFTGIPYFSPELFRRIRLRDPLKMKQLQKGIKQLSEEGSTQVFFPLNNNDIIVGAIGQLQFDVVTFRLKDEYGVEAVYEPVNVHTARWIEADDVRKIEEISSSCLRKAVPRFFSR